MTRDVDDDLYQLDLVDATSRRFLIDRLAHSLGNESIETFMSESLMTVYPESTLATATKRILEHSEGAIHFLGPSKGAFTFWAVHKVRTILGIAREKVLDSSAW